jgi:2-amino-4-ketopentanoate thiolase alpha subunit
MTERALKNTWVEIGGVVLQKDERAPNLPDDTKQVPLEMRVKGFLLHDAEKGGEAEIVTLSGRMVRGTLTGINPEYAHMFGRPIPELSPIAGEIRAILRERRKAS